MANRLNGLAALRLRTRAPHTKVGGMTLREEVTALFDEARSRIDAKRPPYGTLPREDGPDLRIVTVNEVNDAVAKALLLLAERIDQLEGEPPESA